MKIIGRWIVGDDEVRRPFVAVRLPTPAGEIACDFLVDIGADKTVLTRATFDSLRIPLLPETPGKPLSGVGGTVESVDLNLRIVLTAEDGSPAGISGEFSAFLDPDNLDMDILGRDVLNNFDVIVSRRRGEVLLLAGEHTYAVTGP